MRWNKYNYKPQYGNTGHQYAGTMNSGASHITRSTYGSVGKIPKWVWVVLLIGATNLLTHGTFNPSLWDHASADIRGVGREFSAPEGPLYLLDEASVFVHDAQSFESKVREIASMLNVPPEWLMAVMYSESKFDASVKNHKGSGATGLIQFMPATAGEMNVSMARLQRMDHLQQMEYVYLYLQRVRERYGDFLTLTDCYLAILYPKAVGQDPCYTLYAKPSKKYTQNSGLDENGDGRVSVSDIDRRMKRIFPTAYDAKPAYGI
ncbi:transglycosylase SLT domain-containing protein [Pontibacter sp. G13]|uniref:transglycosylase SLT domain-containing protein n=1 Tax=Pontibacter sp. G13 TaxID=3074898 RepID=UPI00288C4F95|nr:transglycosylase SLT domain-containing protein [Pontibacter sp. G13]WNJ17514.1 transglycosylase SLT domain-containing protein [Pontibacter sp. G13]